MKTKDITKNLSIIKRKGDNTIVYSDKGEQFAVARGISDLQTAKKCLTVEKRTLKKMGLSKYKKEWSLD